jgi:hypothetical protein
MANIHGYCDGQTFPRLSNQAAKEFAFIFPVFQSFNGIKDTWDALHLWSLLSLIFASSRVRVGIIRSQALSGDFDDPFAACRKDSHVYPGQQPRVLVRRLPPGLV